MREMGKTRGGLSVLAILIMVLAALSSGCNQEEDEGWKKIPIEDSSPEWQAIAKATTGISNDTGGDFMPKQVHAEHILVKTSQEANSILFDLNKGTNFEEIARTKSLCPSGKKGGDLGWFGRGMMVKEFEDAAFATPPGKISGIVQTQFGYHIIKVLEVK